MSAKKSKQDIHRPKGTRDIFADELVYHEKILDKAKSIAGYYGFSPIKTPHFEKTEVFTSSLGQTSDVVEKQMYTFRTRGGDSLTLRPEGTAPLMRAYLEHGMHNRPQPVMLYYSGSFFRHENPQKGRFREFNQFGVEVMGDESAVSDAVVIRVMTLILEELKAAPGYKLHINSIGDKDCQANYKKELGVFYRKKINYVCRDCRRRIKDNPLRILDCKNPECIEIRQAGAPQILDYLCAGCKNHFKDVLSFLDELNVPYFLDGFLVRGLDYYSRTVFELFPEKKQESKKQQNGDGDEESVGAPLAIISGGRYDYLSKALSRKQVPGVGAAIGLDRLAGLLKSKKPDLAKEKPPQAVLIQLGAQAKIKSLVLMEDFRKAKISVYYPMSKNTLKSQLSIASKVGAPYALIIGQKEAMDGTIMVRNMQSGSQEVILDSKVIKYLKKKLKK